MARHVRGNHNVIARHSYVEYDAGHSQCQVIRCEGSSMKMCIDRPEELSLGLSMHQDETSGTCYVWPVGLVASIGPGEELYGLSLISHGPHDNSQEPLLRLMALNFMACG